MTRSLPPPPPPVPQPPGSYTVAGFMAAVPAPTGSNTPWGERYASEIRQIITHTASQAPRSLQTRLGPSELGALCDRQIVGKLAGLPRTNNVSDPWPSIVGTAVHAWMEATMNRENIRLGVPRWLTELEVAPTPAHPGHTDLYDIREQAVVDWKGVYIHTPVVTPDGWTTMGQLQPGDTVFGADGQPCRVTQTYPVQQRPCYRIKFTDGTDLITDDVQELPFVIAGRKPRPMLMSVAQAVDRVWSAITRSQRQLQVHNGAALDLPERDLPVHPYVLGCWLGDGSVHGGSIAADKLDSKTFDHIEACGYLVGNPIGKAAVSRTIYGLTTQLQQLGLQWIDPAWTGKSHSRLTGIKQIPPEYLRASRAQRLALLQGLMDTDGTWNRPRKRAVFTTTSKSMAESIAELITTLGWKAHIAPHTAHGFGLAIQAYYVEFTPWGDNPFRLRRKADLVRLDGSRTSGYRMVESIEPVLSVPTRCIDVDSSDHLYLCGEQMLPVHNCLGDSTLAKIKTGHPPRKYHVQLLLYGLGCINAGLPVKRVVICALPRTASTLSGMYVWDHPFGGPDDVALLKEVLRVTDVRKKIAERVREGLMRIEDVPVTTDDSECFFCPFYRPQSAYDGGPGCPGTIGNRPA
jgi:LAGLIDADG DNA endonuclease family protein